MQIVMSHARDVNVLHAIDNRVFITIPLYFEKNFIFQSARVENGELIVLGTVSTALNSKSPETCVFSKSSHLE